ncbi:MAG: glycosyltransferase family 1 protein [Polyangiales bacterium]
MLTVAVALAATDLGRSGLGRWVLEALPRLREELARRGHQLCVIATDEEREAYRSAIGAAKVHPLPSALDRPARSALFSLFGVGAYARAIGADVMIAPAANRRTPWRSPVPTISVVHDLATARSSARHGSLRHWFVRSAITRALSTSSAIVAVSATTADEVSSLLGAKTPPLFVARNGVDVQRFCPRNSDDSLVLAARRAVGLGEDEPFVLYPSRLEHPAKNHHRLIAAFAKSAARSTHRLVFVGPDWGAEAMLRAQVEALGLGSRVLFGATVQDATLTGLVSGASLAAIMGTAEGFGLPAIEALASGTPVLAARAGALPEVVEPHGVLVDPYDVDAISSALDRCLADEAMAARVRVAGPKWARSFSWERVAQTLATLCERFSHSAEQHARRGADSILREVSP